MSAEDEAWTAYAHFERSNGRTNVLQSIQSQGEDFPYEVLFEFARFMVRELQDEIRERGVDKASVWFSVQEWESILSRHSPQDYLTDFDDALSASLFYIRLLDPELTAEQQRIRDSHVASLLAMDALEDGYSPYYEVPTGAADMAKFYAA